MPKPARLLTKIHMDCGAGRLRGRFCRMKSVG